MNVLKYIKLLMEYIFKNPYDFYKHLKICGICLSFSNLNLKLVSKCSARLTVKAYWTVTTCLSLVIHKSTGVFPSDHRILVLWSCHTQLNGSHTQLNFGNVFVYTSTLRQRWEVQPCIGSPMMVRDKWKKEGWAMDGIARESPKGPVDERQSARAQKGAGVGSVTLEDAR